MRVLKYSLFNHCELRLPPGARVIMMGQDPFSSGTVSVWAEVQDGAEYQIDHGVSYYGYWTGEGIGDYGGRAQEHVASCIVGDVVTHLYRRAA